MRPIQSKSTLFLALLAMFCCSLAEFASNQNHGGMLHSHLSRKVFDRACAASKDTIDEIVKCVLDSDMLTKKLGEKVTRGCYKDAFGADYMDGDLAMHKELICKSRDKFETMTACVHKSTTENMDAKEMDKFTESLVDVGLCIINALDG